MNPKVLIVDDSMMVRQQVKRALGAGFDAFEAVDGVDALEKATATAAVALVICDVNMPRMNGLDFLEAFRQIERFKTVPVVMLTTEAQPDLVARSRALGAKGWILKPFKADLLTAAVKQLVLGTPS
jgi:two-component system, chemotaxis family, chemotaxis protein CheY